MQRYRVVIELSIKDANPLDAESVKALVMEQWEQTAAYECGDVVEVREVIEITD